MFFGCWLLVASYDRIILLRNNFNLSLQKDFYLTIILNIIYVIARSVSDEAIQNRSEYWTIILPPTPHTITAAGRDIAIEVKRLKQSRRMVMRWNPLKDTLTLSIPTRCSIDRALLFVRERQDWLDKTVGTLPERIGLEFGSKIPVLGEELRIVPADKAPDGEGWLPILATPARCPEIVQTVLKQRLKHYIGEVAEEMADSIHATLTRITIRDTISRWGSCSTDGALSFSWRLIFAPIEVLDYVIAHEVAHLREHNHSPDFWALVEQLDPRYRTHRRWLKTHGKELYRFGELE